MDGYFLEQTLFKGVPTKGDAVAEWLALSTSIRVKPLCCVLG